MEHFRQILNRLPPSIGQELAGLPGSVLCSLEEIRLRCGQQVRLETGKGTQRIPHIVTAEELQETLNRLMRFSYYAYENDLAKGFVTIEGGHRVGVCGKVVQKNGEAALIKEISSLNIRFAKEIKGCSDAVFHRLYQKDGQVQPANTLIISPPGCGKTTLLRDLARNFSWHHIKVGICDERSELAGMYQSRPSFDLGPSCDVLDRCEKTAGIQMLIRSMSPQIIFTDEIGREQDAAAIEDCLNAGISLITSMHGNSREDAAASKIGRLLDEKAFRYVVILSHTGGPGTVKEVLDA